MNLRFLPSGRSSRKRDAGVLFDALAEMGSGVVSSPWSCCLVATVVFLLKWSIPVFRKGGTMDGPVGWFEDATGG